MNKNRGDRTGRITTLRILRWDVLYQEYGTHDKTAQTNSAHVKPHPLPENTSLARARHTFTSMNKNRGEMTERIFFIREMASGILLIPVLLSNTVYCSQLFMSYPPAL
jgi:hypothetical protein